MNPLDGNTKKQVRKELYRIINPLIQGVFRDECWHPISLIYKALSNHGVDYGIEDSKYYQNEGNMTGCPNGKRWDYHVSWEKDGKEVKIPMRITAFFCGSVADPMDAYDMTVTF